jgi:hypothetical protein
MKENKRDRTLRLDDAEARITQKVHRGALRPVHERVRPNRLFLRVAALLGRDPATVVTWLSAALRRADAAPQAFTREQLRAVSPSLLELIETELTPAEREGARDGLCSLLREGELELPPA